jgi:pyridoxamine 5'-phosphate oxidase
LFWAPLGRQIRVEGRVEKLPADESDEYFASRPHGHQLGAWASPQSKTIASLDVVRARHAELSAEYDGRNVPRPPHWGGYRVVPSRIEFWSRGEDRLHERVVFERDGAGWKRSRLAP